MDVIAKAATDADGIIHLAYRSDLPQAGDNAGVIAANLKVIEALGEALEGTGKAFLTSGTLVLWAGGLTGRSGEEDTSQGNPLADSENAAVALAERGVRSVVIRPAPVVHSSLDTWGFTPALIGIARDKGVAERHCRPGAVAGRLGDGKEGGSAADERCGLAAHEARRDRLRPNMEAQILDNMPYENAAVMLLACLRRVRAVREGLPRPVAPVAVAAPGRNEIGHRLQRIPAALATQLRRRLRHEDRRVPGCRVTRTPLTPRQTRSGIKR
jgi:hypothetical protein